MGKRSRKRGHTPPQSAARKRPAPPQPAPHKRPAPPPRPAAGAKPSRGEAKNAAAREALVPLAEGERPRAVTVAAILAALLGIANVVAWAAGYEVRGTRPAATGVLAYSGLMFIAAWGMWRAKYWAVLGMEALLALIIIVMSLLAVRAENVLSVVIALAILGGSGVLFWFLVKAMARIQMPERAQR